MPAENPGARVQELFLAATRVPAEDREQWLHDRCGGDKHLLAEVRSLLRYEDLPHDPLESGPFNVNSLPHKQAQPTVPGYRIVREIGTGGQAIVYEAVQESTTQRVALKVLRWGAMASAQERERLRREVHILARLKHPGIVSIIDCGETEAGVFFIATQFVDGHSVDAFTASKHVDGEGLSTTESLDESLRLFVKICTAVDAAHRAGVVHRDLKPANILVDGEGEPRVLDFGLAKPGLHESLDTDNLELTRSGQFMGSLPWASPEQAEGTVVDARSDVYSLGVILYQLVSGGQFPYDVSGSMREVITKIMHADPTPLTEAKQTISRSPQGVLPAVPLVEEELNAIVLQALAKCPADRYQSAAELAAAINHFCLTRDGGLPRHEVATVAGQRQRGTLSRWLAMLVSLAAVVMVVGYASKGWFANQQQSQVWRDLEFENVGADGEAATELAFPTVSAAALAIRGTLPNKTDGPTIVTLRSTNGMRLQLVFENNGEVRLFAPEMTAPEAKAQLPEGATEFVLAILPDRCLVGTGDEWLLQLHFEISGDWYPTLEPRSDWVGVQRLQYSSDPDSALRSTPQLPPGEQAAVECLIAANGFATSVPDGEQTNPFRIRAMKASKEFMELRGAELVAGCQKLSRLFLSGVKKEAIPHLASLTRLERLSIWTSTLPSGTLERFQLDQLETLDLWNTTLEQPDFSVLAKATNLRYVGIPNVAVTDDDLRDLAQVKSLENLYVNGRLVSVDGLQSLAGLPQLQELELSNVRLTEQLIASLAGLEQIGWLSLRYCDASDVDLEEFVRLQHLHSLLLDGCNISPDGLRRLGRLLPNCRISPAADLPGI